MISKAIIKFVHSLELKKNRNRERLFVAEGPKVVTDLATVVRPKLIIATPEWLTQHHAEIQLWEDTQVCEVTEEELRKTSFLKHPQQVMALFPMREEPTTPSFSALPSHQLCLALDDIQDPGNLGTIIRIADWFGIEHIFCSKETADVYNPKVVQATMGSIAHVQLHYTDLHSSSPPYLPRHPSMAHCSMDRTFIRKSLPHMGLSLWVTKGTVYHPTSENWSLAVFSSPTIRQTEYVPRAST